MKEEMRRVVRDEKYYIADDGMEFSTKGDCIKYESGRLENLESAHIRTIDGLKLNGDTYTKLLKLSKEEYDEYIRLSNSVRDNRVDGDGFWLRFHAIGGHSKQGLYLLGSKVVPHHEGMRHEYIYQLMSIDTAKDMVDGLTKALSTAIADNL